ncbi:hypothetical protein EW146_g2042 [Bondarzewia mesenterica]|uniref:Uncharacterized protein n=1 Tax=Bondarzewia mesenterica TaxID=1095465 RepID=A0A4S4M1U3_9AGAM|nr:hypothetical protein EW146_g2042 [Bondarzewia mesenterica]
MQAQKKLNTLASAIGLKSKKPTLTIQEPPSPVLPLHTHDIDDPPYKTRPPVKSVSSADWDDMFEPATPLDGPRDRHRYAQSIMSVSEDPFAARVVVVPRSAGDPNRLSVFSDASTSDSHPRKGDLSSAYNRMSFASSSSQSHQRGDVPSDSSVASSPSMLHSNFGERRLSRLTVQSEKAVRRESKFLTAQSSPISNNDEQGSRRRIHPSASSSTLTDKNRVVDTEIPPVPRLLMRPRGLTDTGPHRRDLITSSDTRLAPSAYPITTSTMFPSQPRVVVRQASITRIQPPSAPPTAGLPPPPSSSGAPNAHASSSRLQPPSPSSASSSGLSFASSVSSRRGAIQSRAYDHSDRSIKEKKHHSTERLMSSLGRDRSRDSKPSFLRNDLMGLNSPSGSRRELSPPRTLKKAISQQTLPKHAHGVSVTSTSSSATEDGKALKKQRSFHTSRMPMPPLPLSLRHASSFSPPVPVREEPPQPKDQRRVSVQSTASHTNQIPVRKRLFSGASLRRSTSSQAHSTTDDDIHSVFSLPIQDESLSSKVPFSPSVSASSSFWDESSEPFISPSRNHAEYYPKQIMSPAEMLKLEALVQEGGDDAVLGHARGNSSTSVSTSMSNPLSDVMSLDIPLPPTTPPSALQHRDRSSAFVGNATTGQVSRPPNRPSSMISRVLGVPTTPVNAGRPSTSQGNMSSPVSPGRPSSIQAKTISGLSPPPRPRRPSTATGADRPGGRMSIVPMFPLSPPPARRSTRRALETEQILQRRSIMKKPSFLDIDDDVDRYKPPAEDSFLDMGSGKESFDTVRSTDEEFGPE